ncbi:MAG: nitrous oxide-stimulated promoter family protein [Bacillota bacterium]
MTNRLVRERRTVSLMIGIYCRGHHQPNGLCPECGELATYAEQRLARCRFGAQKPTCLLCQVHCYTPAMRARIRDVMRYSGPRMLLHHPVLTIGHWLDGLASSPTALRND